MRHTFLVVTVKWLESVYIYGSYPKIKTGVPLFGPPCIHCCCSFVVCLLAGSREQAFVFALSSTAVLQAVAKTCSTGAASKCGCGRSPSASVEVGGGGGVEGFKWGGCADNVAFGAEFSRAFCDARWTSAKSRRRNKRAATNLHNNNAGRRVSTGAAASLLLT